MWNVGRVVGFSSLLAVLLAVVPGDVLAQKKKKAAEDASSKYPAATEEDYGKLQRYVIGKIASFDSGGKSLTFRVETSQQEANPNYKPPTTNPKAPGYNANAVKQYNLSRKYLDLQTQMQRASTSKNPQQAAQAQARIAQDMASIQIQLAQMTPVNTDPNNQPFITVTTSKDYDLDIEEKVVYRKMFLPLEYDDQGNIKKLSAEEKIALRGDDKTKPGYSAKMEEMQNNQEAKIYLTIPKKKSKTDDDTTPPEHPTINMIVLTKEAPADKSTPAADAPKKKKN